MRCGFRTSFPLLGSVVIFSLYLFLRLYAMYVVVYNHHPILRFSHEIQVSLCEMYVVVAIVAEFRPTECRGSKSSSVYNPHPTLSFCREIQLTCRYVYVNCMSWYFRPTECRGSNSSRYFNPHPALTFMCDIHLTC